jgi:hypothetical protein
MACICEKPECPGEGGGYYVSVVNGLFYGLLLGPYDTHAEALANVDRGRSLADAADPRSHWYAFGTARNTNPEPRKTVFGK